MNGVDVILVRDEASALEVTARIVSCADEEGEVFQKG